MLIEKDLVDVPQEIIKRMKDCQVEQGNRRNAKVFDNTINASKSQGGFNWNQTKEDTEFWSKVLDYKNYDLFFEKYPKVTVTEVEIPKILKEKAYKPKYEVARESYNHIEVPTSISNSEVFVEEVDHFTILDEPLEDVKMSDIIALEKKLKLIKDGKTCVFIPAIVGNNEYIHNLLNKCIKEPTKVFIKHVFDDEFYTGTKLWYIA